jgi:hypothetical protein
MIKIRRLLIYCGNDGAACCCCSSGGAVVSCVRSSEGERLAPLTVLSWLQGTHTRDTLCILSPISQPARQLPTTTNRLFYIFFNNTCNLVHPPSPFLLFFLSRHFFIIYKITLFSLWTNDERFHFFGREKQKWQIWKFITRYSTPDLLLSADC